VVAVAVAVGGHSGKRTSLKRIFFQIQ
jgi:hypothetical protein